jgi:hypothetical protein
MTFSTRGVAIGDLISSFSGDLCHRELFTEASGANIRFLPVEFKLRCDTYAVLNLKTFSPPTVSYPSFIPNFFPSQPTNLYFMRVSGGWAAFFLSPMETKKIAFSPLSVELCVQCGR